MERQASFDYFWNYKLRLIQKLMIRETKLFFFSGVIEVPRENLLSTVYNLELDLN